MKTGKRLAACLLAAVMVLTGCGAKDGGEPAALEGDLETILEEIYAGVDNEETKEFLEGFGQGEITAENAEYYLGSKDVAFAEGLYSEPLINAIAFSVCLVRLEDGADPEEQRSLIEDSVNPNKWICVGAEAVETANIGDVVLLVMGDAQRTEEILAAFEALGQ